MLSDHPRDLVATEVQVGGDAANRLLVLPAVMNVRGLRLAQRLMGF